MDALSQNLGSALAQTILKLGIRKHFAANELIFSEGDMADFLPFVLAGNVKMVRYPEAGKEIILGMFQAGEAFAIPPALDGKRFPATAVAVETSELLLLSRRDFLTLMKTSDEFSSIVLNRMCGILRDRADTVQILATPSAEHRVAGVLLRLAGDINGSDIKKITHRRQDLAEMAGLSLEATIRAVRRLENRGFLKIARGKIYLETTEHLREFVR